MAGLDDLRKVVLSERETGRLTQIPPDLYDRAHATIASLLEKVYAIEDPLSDEARSLIEETVSIRVTVADLFAIRTKKSLSLAENHAQGHYIDREEVRKLIPPEREMFDRIVAAVGSCQDILVQNLSQARLTDNAGSATTLPEGAEAARPPAEGAAPLETPVASEPPRRTAAPANPPYALIRVLADMDTFMGIDGNSYALAKGDIVMVPERNAAVLTERNIALIL